MFSSSHIEISKSAYRNNIRYLQDVIGSGARFSSVIKGNAYGHGIDLIIPMAEGAGIQHFSVFSAEEAYEAKKYVSDKSQIMIMGNMDAPQVEWAVENGIEFFVYDKGRMEKAIQAAKTTGEKAMVHLEVETGFHRTGIEYENREQFANILKDNATLITFKGLCTHYAGAESLANYLRIKNQAVQYKKFSSFFVRKGLKPLLKHTACSAAALTYPATIMDMVRFGIAQYGYWPSPETQMFRFKKDLSPASDSLQRLISWKTRVMSVKKVEAGHFIGYGSSFLTNKKTRIAIIPVGYANGFSRALSNTGRVLIRGRRVPVIGTVTMNTMTVNITDVPEVEIGDEVVLIGKQKRLNISIASFCELSNQLNYQLLTRLPANIPRKIVK